MAIEWPLSLCGGGAAYTEHKVPKHVSLHFCSGAVRALLGARGDGTRFLDLNICWPLYFQAARPVMYLLVKALTFFFFLYFLAFFKAFFSFLYLLQVAFFYFLYLLAFFLFFYLLALFPDYRRRRGLPYAPGPPSLPIIGNLLDIPKDTPWAAYADMSKNYGRREHFRDACLRELKSAFQGDIICFRVFNQVVVVLCSLSAIKDLLEKRGEIYSDRPTLPTLEMYIMISQSFAVITILNFQDRYGLVRAQDGDV